jgi:hypothetical protein
MYTFYHRHHCHTFVILECVAYFLNFVGVVRTEIFTLATDLTIILVHKKKNSGKK